MAKSKYKVGMMINYAAKDTPEAYGRVTGILTTREGYYYQVLGAATMIDEGDVRAAYRPIHSRAKRKKVSKPVEERVAQ